MRWLLAELQDDWIEKKLEKLLEKLSTGKLAVWMTSRVDVRQNTYRDFWKKYCLHISNSRFVGEGKAAGLRSGLGSNECYPQSEDATTASASFLSSNSCRSQDDCAVGFEE